MTESLSLEAKGDLIGERIQSNLSILDTLGPSETVLIEVS